VEEVVSHGQLRWDRHVEPKDMSDWVLACREVDVQGTKRKGRGGET